MKATPYITFKNQCNDAIALYEKAFKTKVEQVMYFKDIPNDPNYTLPEEMKDYILQAKLKIGDGYIRLSDTFDELNEQKSQRTGISIEMDEELVRHAFQVLSENGQVIKELEKIFFSPCYGELIDKYGVFWYLIANE